MVILLSLHTKGSKLLAYATYQQLQPDAARCVDHAPSGRRGARRASIKSDVFYTAVRRHTGMGYRLMITKIKCFA